MGETPESYYEAAITVSQAECNRFLDNIIMAQRADRFSRASLATFGGFSAGVMGVAAASAKAISIVAASFAAADTLFQNFEDTVLLLPYADLLYPQVKARQKLVYDMGKAALTKAKTDRDGDFDRAFIAQRAAAEQAQACTVSGIQTLLTEAVANGAATIGRATVTPEPQQQLVASAILRVPVDVSTMALLVLTEVQGNAAAKTALASEHKPTADALQAVVDGRRSIKLNLDDALSAFAATTAGQAAVTDALAKLK